MATAEDDILLGGVESSNITISELDEKALLGETDEPEIKTEAVESEDLYDAAIEPSAAVSFCKSEVKEEEQESGSPTESVLDKKTFKSSTPTANTSQSSLNYNMHGRKWHVYIGNMTWWTTDDDIVNLMGQIGVKDVVEIRFGENRQNGQSRGYATVSTLSEKSTKVILERAPGKHLNGQLVSVLPFSKQSLAKLEEPIKRLENEKKEEKQHPHNIGQVRVGPQGINRVGGMNNMNGAPPPAPLMNIGFSGPPPNMMIQPLIPPQRVNMSAPPPLLNRPPPSFQQGVPQPLGAPHNNVNTAQALNSVLRNSRPGNNMVYQQQPQQQQYQRDIPPGAHINPQVYPQFAQKPQKDPGQLSAEEYKEVMNRNRTVSSSAIARAMSDATAGDLQSAVETLMTAMSLIKQSRVANDEGCRALLQTLQDALNSIDKQSSSGRKHRRRSRSPSERRSKHHRRSRSRSRSPRYRRY